jgi:hypothetical protein
VERGEVAPAGVTLRSIAGRLAALGDVWAGLPASGQSLAAPMERLLSL